MKGRLLIGLLLIATILLCMYYKMVILHSELVSGFITLIAVIITHIMNSAEDILAALFKIGESPKPVLPVLAPKPLPVTPSAATDALKS